MPSKSPSQARLFAAAAHSASFAKKVGVPQDVAKDFNQADKGTGIIKPKKESVERIVDRLLEFQEIFSVYLKRPGDRFQRMNKTFTNVNDAEGYAETALDNFPGVEVAIHSSVNGVVT